MNELRHLSTAGAKFIAQFEGCVLHPYNDPWNATIGIGHLIHEGVVTDADRRRYARFTLADAYKLLQSDVREVEGQIRARITVGLGQNQWDALVSIVFNCGPGVLEGEVGSLINQGKFEEAAAAWQAWCHGNGGVVMAGLVRRREAERELFLKPEPAYVPYDEQRWETEYDRLRAARRRPLRRAYLRRLMIARRRQIWHLAQKEGWGVRNRTARYRALLARTE